MVTRSEGGVSRRKTRVRVRVPEPYQWLNHKATPNWIPGSTPGGCTDLDPLKRVTFPNPRCGRGTTMRHQDTSYRAWMEFRLGIALVVVWIVVFLLWGYTQ